MKYTMEALQKKDIPSYKSLIDECFGGSNDIEKYNAYSKEKGYRIFVVKDNDEIIGSVTQYALDLFTFDFQPCLMLFNVAVRQNRRRENIASEMLKYVIEQAKAEGYKSVSLTCLGDAYPAHKLYESVGFVRADSVKYELYF